MTSDRVPASEPSPFFHTPEYAKADSLAILHLKRDSLLPITLRSAADDGYAEGAVTNTRFGSFPHSTLIGLGWGSQVRASKVDTGSRGRKGKITKQDDEKSGKKRKPEGQPEEELQAPSKKVKQSTATTTTAEQSSTPAPRIPIEAGSGFVHILPPTPESWTYSLDHRTQVVYTPDSSYILQQLRVRPGDSIIEAGAGSGSFTHAAARAVYDGGTSTSTGRVYSFEFHEPRVATLRDELASHRLDVLVHLSHRDVCAEGFHLPSSASPVTAVFLDLPAPWLALKHLTRSAPSTPLSPNSAIRLCTFSPCIEQVAATVSQLRRAGWVSLRVIEIQNRRLDVRRERVGFGEEGLRGARVAAADVEEAVARLREVERRFREFNSSSSGTMNDADAATAVGVTATATGPTMESKQDRLKRIKLEAEGRKLYREGNLVHRTEPEIKTHTSYLVFAVLPREWSEEDERRCAEKWGIGTAMKGGKE